MDGLQILKEAMSEQLTRVGDISEEKRLKEDLGYDSLTLVDLIINIEDRLGTTFDISDLDPNNLILVKDVILLIDKVRSR